MAREGFSPAPESARKAFPKPEGYKPPKREAVPPPIPEAARRPKPPSEKPPPPRIDVTGATFLAPKEVSLTGIETPAQATDLVEKRTMPARGEKLKAREEERQREAAERGPQFEAGTNAAKEKGAAAFADPDKGTFLFVASEKAGPATVGALAEQMAAPMEAAAARAQQEEAALLLTGAEEVARGRASTVDGGLLKAQSVGTEAAILTENAHLVARGDKATTIEVPPFVAGTVIDEEISPIEFYGDVKGAREQIGAILDGEGGAAGAERRLEQEIADAQAALDAKYAEITSWMGGQDPYETFPSRDDLLQAVEDGKMLPEAMTYLEQVYPAPEDTVRTNPSLVDIRDSAKRTRTQYEFPLGIARTLEKKIADMRQARLTQKGEDFDESFRDLLDDPDVTELAPGSRVLLLEKLREPVALTPETAKDMAAPTLDDAAEARVEEEAFALSRAFEEYKKAKPEEQAKALAVINGVLDAPEMKQVMDTPAERLALYRKVADAYPAGDRSIDILFRRDIKAVPSERALAERLTEPTLSQEERGTVGDIVYEMRRDKAFDEGVLKKDPRFQQLSREGKFALVKRLENEDIASEKQAAELLRTKSLVVRGRPGDKLAMLKVNRTGEITRLDDKFVKRAEQDQVQLGGAERTVEQQAATSLSVPVEAGDQIIVVPKEFVESRFGVEETEGMGRIEQLMAEIKGDPNRSAKTTSQKLKDLSDRPHLALKIPL